jgi:hypothetical protein
VRFQQSAIAVKVSSPGIEGAEASLRVTTQALTKHNLL